MNQVTVDKIQLTIGGKVIELTIEQAKDLKKILNDLWPEQTITITPQPYRESPTYHVVPWPETPVHPTVDPYPWWTRPIITYCQSDNTNVLCLATK